MTLKEIEKVIDEADFLFADYSRGENCGYDHYFYAKDEWSKERIKKMICKSVNKAGNIFTFYKRNDECKLTPLAKVDHIDKEKKVIKKKLDEMTEVEINRLQIKYCMENKTCFNCPFYTGNKCLGWFNTWKKRIEENKDKEFDVEVEE